MEREERLKIPLLTEEKERERKKAEVSQRNKESQTKKEIVKLDKCKAVIIKCEKNKKAKRNTKKE